MGEYRVYRAGEDEPVREAGVDVPTPQPLRRSAGSARAAGARSSAESGRWWLWLLVAAAVAAAAAAYWFFGRDAVSNSKAALDLAKLSGKVPGWAVLAAPIIGVTVVALVTAYVAFGRHLAVKIVGVAAVVAVLATPGLAVGYANGLVAGVGSSGKTTQVERTDIAKADKQIDRPIPNQPVNILLIGSDKSNLPGDPGRSDTQMLVRLDPQTKSISMLSLPRDLQVDIPGVGVDKMNAAFSYGGPALVIQTFKQLTGLPINHWIEVNFGGFWHVVNILGGIYLPIDHRYAVSAGAGYKSIDLEPGYQLVRGKQALNFVRFRHDQKGDFTRMQRQQLFLREVQRQSRRWSGDWTKVIKLIRAITGETKSDLSSLKKLAPLVELAFQIDTSKVFQAHLEGATPMINGVSYVTATDAEIAAVVHQFTNPTQAPVKAAGTKVSRKMYTVTVHNGSGIPGRATSVADQLTAQGYQTVVGPDAPEFPDNVTVVYAPKGLQAQAKEIGSLLWPSEVRVVDRAPGVNDDVTVFLASSFGGIIAVPQANQQPQQTLEKNQKADWASWQALDKSTPLKLEAPTAWSPGFTYDQFRNYTIETTTKKQTAASVAVVRTSAYGYWSVQAMRWLNPPAVQHPDSTQTIGGRKYLLFYQGDNLHLVAWREHGTLYWIINTLDNELSSDVMLGLATSCKPVR
jgi:LCP family protein required for cell wall assembly